MLFLGPDGTFQAPDAKQVIKNGWMNMAKLIDKSTLKLDELILEAVTDGWQPASIKTLFHEFGASLDEVDRWDESPATIAARYCRTEALKTLIDLKAEINKK